MLLIIMSYCFSSIIYLLCIHPKIFIGCLYKPGPTLGARVECEGKWSRMGVKVSV